MLGLVRHLEVLVEVHGVPVLGVRHPIGEGPKRAGTVLVDGLAPQLGRPLRQLEHARTGGLVVVPRGEEDTRERLGGGGHDVCMGGAVWVMDDLSSRCDPCGHNTGFERGARLRIEPRGAVVDYTSSSVVEL